MLRIILWGIAILIVVQNVGMVVLGKRIEKQFDAAAAFDSRLDETKKTETEIYQIKGVDKVLNSSAGGQTKPGFKSLAKFRDIDAPRLIRFSAVINPESLLKENEDLPEKEFLDIFMEARSVKYGLEECERLSKILTSECVIRGSHATSRAEGKYKMTFALSFVQKSDFGQVGAGEKVLYQEISQTFQTPPRPKNYSGKDAEEERIILYKKMKEQCDLLVDRQGNCAVSGIDISTRKKRGRSGEMFTSGKAVYSLLHSDGEVKDSSDAKNE